MKNPRSLRTAGIFHAGSSGLSETGLQNPAGRGAVHVSGLAVLRAEGVEAPLDFGDGLRTDSLLRKTGRKPQGAEEPFGRLDRPVDTLLLRPFRDAPDAFR